MGAAFDAKQQRGSAPGRETVSGGQGRTGWLPLWGGGVGQPVVEFSSLLRFCGIRICAVWGGNQGSEIQPLCLMGFEGVSLGNEGIGVPSWDEELAVKLPALAAVAE